MKLIEGETYSDTLQPLGNTAYLKACSLFSNPGKYYPTRMFSYCPQ